MQRFYYHVKEKNRIEVVWAYSKLDAIRKVALSGDAPLLNKIEWLGPNQLADSRS